MKYCYVQQGRDDIVKTIEADVSTSVMIEVSIYIYM